MNIDTANKLINESDRISIILNRLASWAYQYNDEDYYMTISYLKNNFNNLSESMSQYITRAQRNQEDIINYININHVFTKHQQLNNCVAEMNTLAMEIDITNKLVDCTSQIVQIERAIEDKHLSEESAKNYINNGNYETNIYKIGEQYSALKTNDEKFDTQSTLAQVGSNIIKMSTNYENSLSITNNNPESKQEEIDKICKIQTIEPDKQDIESINIEKQQLDMRIQQAFSDAVKDIGTDEVLDCWVNDLQYIETCLTDNRRIDVDDVQQRISIMESRIGDSQLYTTKTNIALEDKVQELKFLEQQIDELTTRTQTATSEYVCKGSEIIVDKINSQMKTISSLERIPTNDFAKYSNSVMKQVATQLRTTQETTQIKVNPQLINKCKTVNETCKQFSTCEQFSNDQIQNL